MMAAERGRERREEEGEGEGGRRGPARQERWIISDSQCEIISQLLCSVTESLPVGPGYRGIHCIWI